ncbi:MAG: hypothetical protein CHACPFDD_04191 [Phycisphaerae bacterium]|nr:hypothetical protein [Phycisphaerae bacterium]
MGITVSGSPDAGTGSILLIDGPRYQQVRVRATATLSAGADNCGVVFGYVDRQNFWLRLFSKAQQKVFVYQVSSGTWTQKNSANFTITAGTPFTIQAQVRSGLAHNYAGAVPAGQVGLWCSHGSANSFDDFTLRDLVGPYEADGKWFSDKAEVQVDQSDNNLLKSSSATSNETTDTCIVRRGFRAGKYVATFRFKWAPGPSPGFLVRWVNPGDWLAVMVRAADGRAWVYKRVNDGVLNPAVMSGTVLSLSSGNWYTAKVLVDDDTGNSALQRLRFWIDTDGDGTWSDETTLIDTTTVDDDWSAGYVGLFHGEASSAAAQEFDDVKLGLDTSSPKDGDFDDSGDSVVINDDFASNTTSLSYDDNGNLTDDGIFKFTYDAWNRLVAVKSRYSSGTTQTTFATYAYDGANRRTKKVVQNNGVEVYPNDGGNTTVHFYYGGVDPEPTPFGGLMPKCWNIFETRNGSNQTTWQYFWGTQYVDEIILTDKNGDPTVVNDCDPDGTAGESSESPADHRYFAHQDRAWNVGALTDYGAGVNGDVAEREISGAYGYLAGGDLSATSASCSTIGVPRGLELYCGRARESASNWRSIASRPSLPPGQEPRSAPEETVTISCIGASGSSRNTNGSGSVAAHCDVICKDVHGQVAVSGGCSGPDGAGVNDNGNPSWYRYDVEARNRATESHGAPSGTCECIRRHGDDMNDVPRKSYNALLSNSNSCLSQILTCCGLDLDPPPGISAPGWGRPVRHWKQIWGPLWGWIPVELPNCLR